MRITADVIDEESCCGCGAEAAAEHESKVKYVVRDASLARHYHVMFNNMLKKFKHLNMSDITLPAMNACHTTCEENFLDTNQFGTMEDFSLEEYESETEPKPEKHPMWLPMYLAEMKSRIKKEVIEDVLQTLLDKHLKADTKLSVVNFKDKEDGTSEQIKENDGIIHDGIFCDNCDNPIHGIRYKCGNCTDFDLCEECECIPDIHEKSHIFLKIRHPLPPQSRPKKRRPKPSKKEVANNAEEFFLESSTLEATQNDHVKTFNGLMEAKFIGDETVPDETMLSPGTKFMKSWRIFNSGTKSWTKDTVLRYLWGSKDLRPLSYEVEAPQIQPGEEGIVSVHFIAPILPGRYQSHWEFHHRNLAFGHRLWCHIQVLIDGPLSPELIEPQISPKGLPENEMNLKTNMVPFKCTEDETGDNCGKEVTKIAEVLTAVQEEHKRGNFGPRKLVVTSHTATPNNTPFDVTPPKSPEPQEFVVKESNLVCNDSITVIDESITQQALNQPGSEFEDSASIRSLSSSESDTEFVVIPMPRCFSFSEPFSSPILPPFFPEKVLTSAVVSHDSGEDVKTPNGKQGYQNITANTVLQAKKSTENVSQETGAPEEAENFNIQATIQLKEDCDTNEMVSDVTLSCSSSGVSIIESEENSPIIETSQTVNSAVKEKPVQEPVQIEEHNSCDIHTSGTIPKFPVTGDSSETASNSSQTVPKQERTIQVLPEGLVTGALLAAATVYNTARAVISSIQPGKNDQEENLSQGTTPNQSGQLFQQTFRSLDPAEQLIEMGFCNRSQNVQLLTKHQGDVAMVVAELISMNDNDWYASRHSGTANSEGIN